MSRDLNDINEIFGSAYRQLKEGPSPEVWEKISNSLDQKDAKLYKRKLANWKKAAMLMFFLLMGFIIYESRIFNKNSSHSIKNNSSVASGSLSNEGTTSNNNSSANSINKIQNRDPIVKQETSNVNSFDVVKNKTNTLIPPGKTFFEVTNESQSPTPETTFPVSDSRPTAIPVEIKKPDQPGSFAQFSNLSIKNKSLINIADNFHSSEISLIKNKSLEPSWNLTAFVSQDHANYRLDNDSKIIMKIKQHEEREPSLSGGIIVARQFRHFTIQSGIIYSNTAIAIRPQKIYADHDLGGAISYKYETSSGNAYIKPVFDPQPIPGDSLTAENAKHNLKNVGIPIIFKLSVSRNKKFNFSTGLGIEGNFLTKAKIETEVEDASHREHILINQLEGTRPFYLSLMANAEIGYFATRNISLNVYPNFRFALTPVNKNNDIETFPYAFGLGFGVTYKF